MESNTQETQEAKTSICEDGVVHDTPSALTQLSQYAERLSKRRKSNHLEDLQQQHHSDCDFIDEDDRKSDIRLIAKIVMMESQLNSVKSIVEQVVADCLNAEPPLPQEPANCNSEDYEMFKCFTRRRPALAIHSIREMQELCEQFTKAVRSEFDRYLLYTCPHCNTQHTNEDYIKNRLDGIGYTCCGYIE